MTHTGEDKGYGVVVPRLPLLAIHKHNTTQVGFSVFKSLEHATGIGQYSYYMRIIPASRLPAVLVASVYTKPRAWGGAPPPPKNTEPGVLLLGAGTQSVRDLERREQPPCFARPEVLSLTHQDS